MAMKTVMQHAMRDIVRKKLHRLLGMLGMVAAFAVPAMAYASRPRRSPQTEYRPHPR